MTTRRKRAIVIGPYRGDTVTNIAVAGRCAVWLWNNGYSTFCPHLNTMNFDVVVDCDDSHYIEFNCDLINTGIFDVCVVLPNWRASEGTTTELDHIANYINDGNDIEFYLWDDTTSCLQRAELTIKTDLRPCQENAPTTG